MKVLSKGFGGWGFVVADDCGRVLECGVSVWVLRELLL